MSNKEIVLALLNTALSKLDIVKMDDIVENIEKFSLLYSLTNEENTLLPFLNSLFISVKYTFGKFWFTLLVIVSKI